MPIFFFIKNVCFSDVLFLQGGGNLVQTIRRSYSLSDLSEPDVHRTQDEVFLNEINKTLILY